ncbi:ABC transporter substrate-binding protein [Arenicella xantha]|uniref:ABC-type branched-subunit amino acid transport system substrate-binding protein n=1 Tax=Arenicella xantha TaxID=644221 RepID=A0A395JLU3_9GAMM|nr:ABC transporter substrate-binding protein [Arenicella xantha]RBP49928.1 ABC-type branched-subunit amino acid transport system substrate-binding protein [Arenicella xantha]
MFNLGIIIPQSSFLPHLSRDLPVACKMGLGDSSDRVKLCFESGGYNEDAGFLKDKIQGLIIRENLNAVLCPLNSSLIESVNELCRSEETALLVNTMGEDVLFDSAANESVFVNSYQLWQNAWLTGYYAAQLGFKDLATVYARHDGGYGVPLAVAVGAEAGGANVKLSQVTHMDSADEDCSEFIQYLDKMEPDAIIAHHSSKEAINFLRDAEQAELESPLLTLPPFVEEPTLNQLGSRIEGTKTVGSHETDSEQYQRFSADFKAQTGRLPHPHIVMAYESVKLIVDALDSAADQSYASLINALEHAKISGPRGCTRFNQDAKNMPAKYYIREVCRDESGLLHNKTLTEHDVPELCHEHYALAQKNTQKQGWVNPYQIA